MYRIRHAALLAGMTPELLRAWERRYGLVSPVRTDSGYRVYSDDDVRVLQGAKRLVDAGQSIAEVAQLPRTQLMGSAVGTTATSAFSPLPDLTTPAAVHDFTPAIQEALTAISLFDQERLESSLFRVMGLVTMPPEELCEIFLLPLLSAIGDEWEAGRLSIAAEHFGSGIIRSKILRFVEHDRAKSGAPAVVCACPAGEEHEGALLAFAVSASRAGMRVVYLGADTPAEEIVRAAERTGAKLVGLSLTKVLSIREVEALVSLLEPWRKGGAGRQVLVGGRGADKSRNTLQAAGLEVADRISVTLPGSGPRT